MRYKIHVKSLSGVPLVFSVNEYDVVNGFVVFIDRITSKTKMFAVANCEIEVLQ